MVGSYIVPKAPTAVHVSQYPACSTCGGVAQILHYYLSCPHLTNALALDSCCNSSQQLANIPSTTAGIIPVYSMLLLWMTESTCFSASLHCSSEPLIVTFTFPDTSAPDGLSMVSLAFVWPSILFLILPRALMSSPARCPGILRTFVRFPSTGLTGLSCTAPASWPDALLGQSL